MAGARGWGCSTHTCHLSKSWSRTINSLYMNSFPTLIPFKNPMGPGTSARATVFGPVPYDRRNASLTVTLCKRRAGAQ